MIETFTGGGPGRPESNEEIKPTEVNFYKLGGTWDMVFRDGQKIGTGNLDDDALKKIQEAVGYFSENWKHVHDAELKLARNLWVQFQKTRPEEVDAGEHLSSWAKMGEGDSPTIKDFIQGPFYPLFSGDSSHLESPLIAPMVATLIERLLREPNKPILGGQGTDTADIALLALFDALTFDTQLSPLILAGANRSHMEENSDAPRNFVDLGKLTRIDLPPGAYWVFQGDIHTASDFIKIDPTETRAIEGQTTFHSPHRTNQRIDNVLELGRKANWEARRPPELDHVIWKMKPESLFEALDGVYTIDLGSQNSLSKIVLEPIYDDHTKGIVIAAHSLGNVSNRIRFDAVRVAKEGKLVVDVSRTLIGDVNEEYAASLLSANRNPEELAGTGKLIISAHKLSKSTARALTSRAILDGLDQQQTQELFTAYARSRKLL